MVFTIPDIFAKTKVGEGAREYFTLHGLPNRRDEDFHYTDLSRALQDCELKEVETPFEIEVTKGDASLVKLDHLEPAIIDTDDNLTRICKGATSIAGRIIVSSGFDGEISLETQDNSNSAIELKIAANSNVVLRHKSLSGVFATLDMKIEIQENAQLSQILMPSKSQGLVIENYRIAVAKSGKYGFSGLFIGSKTTRFDMKIALNGEGAEANINGVYVLNKTHFDFSSNIAHNAPNCESHTIMRGIANDGAQAVFQGKILVAKGAKKTIGNMEHRGIMIEDGARIFAKPSLEIYNDDVECSHANTIGAIDESALFYMQSRGISKAKAKTILTHAFLASVFDQACQEFGFIEILETNLEEMLNV